MRMNLRKGHLEPPKIWGGSIAKVAYGVQGDSETSWGGLFRKPAGYAYFLRLPVSRFPSASAHPNAPGCRIIHLIVALQPSAAQPQSRGSVVRGQDLGLRFEAKC